MRGLRAVQAAEEDEPQPGSFTPVPVSPLSFPAAPAPVTLAIVTAWQQRRFDRRLTAVVGTLLIVAALVGCLSIAWMVADGGWPGESTRMERFHRLLDVLAAVPNRGMRRRNAIRTLGLRLTARQERLLLAMVAVWEQAPEMQEQPTLPQIPAHGTVTRPFDWPRDWPGDAPPSGGNPDGDDAA